MKTKELQKKLMDNLIALSNIDIETDICEHLPLLFDLCISKQAKTIVELGVRAGLSTQAFLTATSYIPDGKLYSYDIKEIQPDSYFKGWGILKRLPECRSYDFWDFKIGDSREVYKDWEDESIDILFIDTKHKPDMIFKELSLWHKKIKPTSMILMHDVILKKARLREGIERFQKEYPQFRYAECAYNNGLGILFDPKKMISGWRDKL